MRKNAGSRRMTNKVTVMRNKVQLKRQDLLEGPRKPMDKATIEAARWCWEFSTNLCTSLGFLNCTKVDSFEFMEASTKKLILFYLHLFFLIPSGLHKFYVFARRIFSRNPLDSITCFCVLPCVIYCVYFLMLTVFATQFKEVQLIIHGWRPILRHFNKKTGRNLTPFSYVRTAMISVQMFLSLMISVLGYIATSLILHQLPFVLAQTITELGLLPSNFPKWALCLLLAPVEGYCYFAPFLIIVAAMEVALYETTVTKLCFAELRNKPVDPMSQAYVKKMLNALRLRNEVFSNFVRDMIFPMLYIAGVVCVFLLYLVIKNDKLPIINTVIMSYTAVVILAAVYFLSEELVSIIQASEDVKKNLRPTLLVESYKYTPREILRMHVKEAKALRPLEYPVGHFSMFSFEVTITFYEEVLNQLLFLLYL